MHSWGDGWPYWHDLNTAILRIQIICRRYGRINMLGKEKYGTFRDEYRGEWDGTLHSLLYPGHYFIRYKNQKFYHTIDYPIIRRLSTFSGIKYLVNLYQAAVYNYAIQSTIKRYPHLEEELVSDIDAYYLVRPGIFGQVDGQAIHRIYWR